MAQEIKDKSGQKSGQKLAKETAKKPGLSYKARRRWSLFILLIGLPLYIAFVLFVVSLFDRPPVLPWYGFVLELVVYIFLGVAWIFPFKSVFLGVGQADPDAQINQTDKK
jgi:uncharacterized membrane protein